VTPNQILVHEYFYRQSDLDEIRTRRSERRTN
jgi:hypothetical protein